MPANSQTAILRERYQEALLKGDAELALRVVEDGLSSQIQPTKIYLDVLAPSVVHIGNLWHQGEINVAQEHLAVQIILRQMDHLTRLLSQKKKLGLRVVVTAVENEHHAVGARILADFLAMDGWEVDFLGDNTPTTDLVEFVRQRDAHLVGLSVTLKENLPHAKRAIREIHALEPSPKIMIGGGVLHSFPNEAGELGADAQITDTLGALQEARRLLGLDVAAHTLDDYLRTLGARVQSARKNLHWSQQELADRASLDRTYISMVEHGKQNLTLGAMMRIADALEVNLDTLLG